LTGLVIAVGSSFAAPAWAEGVTRIVQIQTPDISAYVQQIKLGQAILKQINSPATFRVYVATYAGPNAGDLIVSVGYDSIVLLAQDEAREMASPEYRAWIVGLDKMRKIVSDSIYRDITP
jgi:hypothetical protein